MLCDRCGEDFPFDESHEGPDGKVICARCSEEVGGRPYSKVGEVFDAHAVPLEQWGGPIETPVETEEEAAADASAPAPPPPAPPGAVVYGLASLVAVVTAAATFALLSLIVPKADPPVASPPATNGTPDTPDTVPAPTPNAGGGDTTPAPVPAAAPTTEDVFRKSVETEAAKLAEDYSNVADVLENLRLLEGQTEDAKLADIARASIGTIEGEHDAAVEAIFDEALARIDKALQEKRYGDILEELSKFEKAYGTTNFYYMQGSSKITRTREKIDDLAKTAIEAARTVAKREMAAGNIETAAAAYDELTGLGLARLTVFGEERAKQVRLLGGLGKSILPEEFYWKAVMQAGVLSAERDFAGALKRLDESSKSGPSLPNRIKRDVQFYERAHKTYLRARANSLKLKGREFTVGDLTGKVLIVDATGFRIRNAGTLHRFKLDDLDATALGGIYDLDPDPALGDGAIAVGSMALALGDAEHALEKATGAAESPERSDILARVRRTKFLAADPKPWTMLKEAAVHAKALELKKARDLFAIFCLHCVRADKALSADANIARIAAALGVPERPRFEGEAPPHLGRLVAAFTLDDCAENDTVRNVLDPDMPGRVICSEEGPNTTDALSIKDGKSGGAFRLDGSWEHIEAQLKGLVTQSAGAIEFWHKPSRPPVDSSALAYTHGHGVQVVIAYGGTNLRCFGGSIRSGFRPASGEWAHYRVEWQREPLLRALYVNGKRLGNEPTAEWRGTLGDTLRLNAAHNQGRRGMGQGFGDYDELRIYAGD